jgi:hypothetical protein
MLIKTITSHTKNGAYKRIQSSTNTIELKN